MLVTGTGLYKGDRGCRIPAMSHPAILLPGRQRYDIVRRSPVRRSSP